MIPELRTSAPLTLEEAARIATEFYGLAVTADRLPGEYDQNFHLIANDGREFVLKVMHESRDRSLVDMQCEALQHLARHAPDLRLPRVQANREGKAYSVVRLGDGDDHIVWLLTYVPGKVLAKVRPHSPELLAFMGELLGQMDRALQSFSHPAADRVWKWDSAQALWIRDYLHYVSDASRYELVERSIQQYESHAVPLFPHLRISIIYGDANDYNVLVDYASDASQPTVSVIDFGDMHRGFIVAEAAVAAAYAILGKDDPLPTLAAVVSGFHKALPLSEDELSALFPLVKMRLAVSVVNSAHRKTMVPDDPYVTISEEPAWDALRKLTMVHSAFAHYTLRHACGLSAVPRFEPITTWLSEHGKNAASVLDVDLRGDACHVVDLSVGSTFLGADPRNAEASALTEAIKRELARVHASVGVGRYDEARAFYTSEVFRSSCHPSENRTLHLGIDLFVDPGTNVRAPLDGVVYAVADNNAPLDYGPLVILKHCASTEHEFFTLYGHLSRESIAKIHPGLRIAKGQPFAKIGNQKENGGWAPHLHLQIIVDLLERNENFPGVACASEREVWKSLSPDPNLLLNIPADRFPQESTVSETLAQRRSVLGRNLSVSYRKPLKIVRGWQQYLYDDTGRSYLDVYNNVPLVGHSHPHVVEAIQRQVALLNTNTRYLHDNAVRYAEALVAKLPDPLRVCYFVNSGSEANELALRLARTHTGAEDIIVLEHAYHGNTSTLIDISPYKFDGPGGQGRRGWVHVAPLADDYRGLYRRGEASLGSKYASHIVDILDGLRTQKKRAAAFIAETMPSVGGQILFPEGYLAETYRHLRSAGVVCIADEVQVGFGRIGTHFWGFETQNVVPDIVVLGKPIGNAFPLAAVVATPEIAASFDNGMEFFSTFGGNPVACAAGLAVLDVLAREHLQENARRVGNKLLAAFRELQQRHEIIGDVRGSGLFLGLDLVLDRATRQPAPTQASYITNRMRECGILTGTDGPHHNVLKLRPPLIFSDADADRLVSTLDSVLDEDLSHPRPGSTR